MKRKSAILLTVIVVLSSFVSRAVGEPGVDELYGYARALYENECFFPAVVRLTELIDNHPGNKHIQEAKYLIGECLQGEKKYWKAIDHWKKVRDEYPGTDTAKKCEESIRMVMKITEINYLSDKEELRRYPVTIEDMIMQTFVDNIIDHEGRMVINDDYIKPEFEKGAFWSDRILSECKGSPIAVIGQDKKGHANYKRNTPADCKKGIEEYLKIMDMFPEEYGWILFSIKWCAQLASDSNQLGNTKYSAELYMKLIEEAKKRLGDVSYHGSFAKTQLRIMGKKID